MTRSQSRELAFVWLFQKSFTGEPMDEILEASRDAGELLPEDPFALELTHGAIEHLSEIDDCLEVNSKNWKLARVSKVALSAMRLACYEILFDSKIPVGASINEAVELTKKYAGPEDASYVNGVLGAVAKGIGSIPDAPEEDPAIEPFREDEENGLTKVEG